MRRLAHSRIWTEQLVSKVPQITVLFWTIKLLTTAMGEAASDYLGKVSIALAGVVGFVGLVLALWLQLRAERYDAVRYWFAVSMVAVFGTMAADGVHVALGLPYPVTSTGYALALAAVFVLWRRSEGTLSIHSILSRRRELFYWSTVLMTFALGTAVGDLTAVALHLGFLTSGILFVVAFAVPAIAWRFLHANPIVSFWTAYVLTRPLGASFADWFSKPHSFGRGLGYGDGPVAAVLLVVIAVLVGYLAITRRDISPPAIAPAPREYPATVER